MKIVIVDYGVGNFGAINNMIKKLGKQAIISAKVSDIEKADKLILPGVGSFDSGIKNLEERNLISTLNKKVVKDKIPILGICLGMQLMTKQSEEGKLSGLGWIDAKTVKFSVDGLRVPHMGWNKIKIVKDDSLFKNLPEEVRFYFAHSYYVKCADEKNVLSTTNYGQNFSSIIKQGNIIGVQFHPEKSHKYGMQILKNFIER